MSRGRRPGARLRCARECAAPYCLPPCPRRAYSTRPSSPPPASTRGPPGRTSRSPRSSRRARPAPHLRAIYGFARLVDNLGDEAPGDRTRCSTSSSASSTGRRAPRSCAGCTRRSRPARCRSSRFAACIQANRIDQVQAPLRDVGGRARVLHVLGRAGRPPRARDLRPGGRARARGDERRRLHGAPARQLPPGPAARPRARPRLPAPRGPASLRRRRTRSSPGRSPSGSRRSSASRQRGRARSSSAVSRSAARWAGGPGSRSRSTRAGGLAALDALERAGWDVFTRPPGADPLDFRPPGPAASSCADERRGRLRGGRCASPGARRGTSRGASRVLPRPKRQAVAALYAFARRVDDIADDPDLPAQERRARLEACREAVEALPAAPDGDPVLVALADAIARYPDSAERARRPRRRRAHGRRTVPLRELGGAARVLPLRRGRGRARLRGRLRAERPGRGRPRAETLGLALQQINIMRDVAEDWRLGRVYLPQDELERFGVSEEDIAAGRSAPAGGRSWSTRRRARSAPARRSRAAAAARPAERALRSRLRGHLPRPARRRCARAATTCSAAARSSRRSGRCGRSPRCEGRASSGGGLAGLAAALELVDAGTTVTLLEARPTLGGAVQTLPGARGRSTAAARQRPAHRARLLHGVPALPRRGSGRPARFGASRSAAGDRRGRRVSRASRRARWASFATGTSRLRERLGDRSCRASPRRGSTPASHDGETFAALLRRLGQSQAAIDRFWDVFIRPALNLRERGGRAPRSALFTVQTALSAVAAASDLDPPRRAARGDARRRGGGGRSSERGARPCAPARACGARGRRRGARRRRARRGRRVRRRACRPRRARACSASRRPASRTRRS